MPTTVTEIYREHPGKFAHPVWDSFKENGGLYLVAGGRNVGKTTFLKKLALDAAAYLGFSLKDIVTIHTGEQEFRAVKNLVYPGNVYDFRRSHAEQEVANKSFVAQAFADVQAQDVKMVVIDDIRSQAAAQLASTLVLHGYIVFAVFGAYKEDEVVKNFEARILNGLNPSALKELPVRFAWLSLFFEHDIEGHIRREGFASYGKGVLSVPAELG